MTIEPLNLDFGGPASPLAPPDGVDGLQSSAPSPKPARPAAEGPRQQPAADAVARFQAAMDRPSVPDGLVASLAVPRAVTQPADGSPEESAQPAVRTACPPHLRFARSACPTIGLFESFVSPPVAPEVADRPVDGPHGVPAAPAVAPEAASQPVDGPHGVPAAPAVAPQAASQPVDGSHGVPAAPAVAPQAASQPAEGPHGVPAAPAVVPQAASQPVDGSHSVLAATADTFESGAASRPRPAAVSEKKVADNPAEEPSPLQALPFAMPAVEMRSGTAVAAAPQVVALELDPASATARTQELVDAASAVAETLSVTPSLVHGEGEVTIRLRPTVLDGSEIRVAVSGGAMTVALAPATAAVQQLLEANQARFAEALAERIPSFQVAVVVQPRATTSRKGLDDETA